MSDTTQNNNTTNNENNSSLTAAEIARIAVEQMYNLAMGAVGAGSALIDNKIASTTMTFWSGGVDLFKNQVTNPNDNHYQGTGRAVGDMLNLAITFWVQEKVNKVTVSGKTKAGVAFGTYFELANINLGEKFSNLFNTYVANADRFYDEIITNSDFFEQVKNGLINNGIMNFVDYFDPDGDGNVSAIDIVNGYQKLFSPPPAFETMDFEIQFSSNKPKEIIIKADISKQEEEKEIIQAVMKHDEIQTLTLNSHTYNIKELSNLQILNALDYIPKVSFLLSNILIKVGEEIDLGSKGIYTIKSGDTLSEIAQDNGMITKDLLKLNTWLLDENRVKFLQNKILVDTTLGESELNNKNHTLIGDSNAENILIDANGGDNEFIGGSKADKMESKGKGYDIYQANGGDEITDSDGDGEVKFNGTVLTSGLYNKDKGYYESEDKSIEYHLNGNTLIVKDTTKNESITINNYSKEDKSLGIDLIEADEIDIIISNATVTEGDESKPNKDGKAPYSTSLGIKLSRELKEDEFIIIQKYNYEKQSTELVLFGTLPQDYDTGLFKSLLSDNKTVDFSWYGNTTKEEDRKYCVGGVSVFAKSDNLIIRDIKPGTVTMKDDDRDPDDDLPETYDPLVIDLNNDGVKGTSLDYSISFDLNSDGFKESSSWIDSNDEKFANLNLLVA